MKPIRYFTEFKNEIKNSPDLQQKLQTDPIGTLEEVQVRSPIEDPGIFKIVIYMVGVALLLSIIIGAIIALQPAQLGKDVMGNDIIVTREVPDFVITLGSTALGALAGLLSAPAREAS